MEKGKKPIQEEEENGFSSLKNYQSNVASSSSELPLKFETAFEQSGKPTKTQSLLGFCKKKKNPKTYSNHSVYDLDRILIKKILY